MASWRVDWTISSGLTATRLRSSVPLISTPSFGMERLELLDLMEASIGKAISGRDSEDVVDAFGGAVVASGFSRRFRESGRGMTENRDKLRVEDDVVA